MKTICIYHSVDLDGWMSAAIVKHFYSQDKLSNGDLIHPIDFLDFLGFNHGDSIPDLSNYDHIIMCDISFPKDKNGRNHMIELFDRLNTNFIWLDHHISAIKENDNNIEGIRDTKFAACELTWLYFFPNDPMPEIVRLLGRYDCFGHKGTDEEQTVLEFQYGARTVISNYEEAYRWLKENIDFGIKTASHIHKLGEAVYSYLCQEAKQVYKNGFEIYFKYKSPDTFNKVQFICINKERFNPINFGIDYHKDGYDGCACFYFDGKQYNFSLYNDNGLVDVSLIAKQFGGGGHKGASGFRIKSLNEIGL